MSNNPRETNRLRFALDLILASGSALWNRAVAKQGRDRLVLMAIVALLLASPWSMTNALLLAGMLFLATREPGFATAILPATAPFAYQPKVLFGPQFPVVELLLLGALAGTAVRAVVSLWTSWRGGAASASLLDAWDTVRLLMTRAPGLQAALLALLGVASLLTVADPAHLRESVRELRTVVLEPVAFLFLALYWLPRAELRLVAIAAYLTGAAAVAALAVAQFVSGANVVLANGSRRVTSVYQHPNNLALYLGRALAFGIGAVAGGARLARSRLVLVALGMIGAGLLLSVSLGAFLGVGIATLLAALLARNPTTRIALLGGLVVVALAVLLFARGRVDALLGGGGSVGLRRMIWGSALAMLRDRPAFGVGLDQFLYQYAPRYVQPAAWAERFTAHPHNLVLDFWLRLGILGVAWLGWTLLTVARHLLASLREATDEARALYVAVAAALVAATVHGLVDNFFFLIDLAYVWWFFIALAYTSSPTDAAPARTGGVDRGRARGGRARKERR